VRKGRLNFTHLKAFEQRKSIVEKRMLKLGDIFAVAIYSDAVTGNHLHGVLSALPDRAWEWADEEVAARRIAR